MSHEYLNDVRVQIGAFPTDVPEATLAQWRAVIKVPIQVHFNPETGIKTYLVNDFPNDQNSFEYAITLVEAGITEARSVHLFQPTRIRMGWNGYLVIGPQESVINPVTA